MAKRTINFGPEIFFSIYDALSWIEKTFEEIMDDGDELVDLEMKLMPSGGYRVGLISTDSQLYLFGAEQDA